MEDKKIMLYAALAILGACFLYFFAVTFMPIPASGAKYADLILGALIGSGFTAIAGYYWGSSKGSADKNDAMLKE